MQTIAGRTGPWAGRLVLLFLAFALALPAAGAGAGLRVATINVWSGLDYKGLLRVGEYEPAEQREERFQALLLDLREAAPGIIALQEANPVRSFARRLADSLGYDMVCQRTNSGLKIGSFGIPHNLNEGLAILARRDLHLRFLDVWPLSGVSGVIGNALSFHGSEANIALLARVVVAGRELSLVNLHLCASVPDDSASRAGLTEIMTRPGAPSSEIEQNQEVLARGAARRDEEASRLCVLLSQRLGHEPFLLLGDFNATPESRTLALIRSQQKVIDAAEAAGCGQRPTWDPASNPNIRFSLATADRHGRPLGPLDLLGAWYDSRPRRIDYILLGPAFAREDVQSVVLLGTTPRRGTFVSDHYGVVADLDLSRFVRESAPATNSPERAQPKVEPLPIVSYDSNAGIGYGAKVFLLDRLGHNESFDLIAFNSSKGERWYRLAASCPDLEVRQGKVYPWAVDFTLDYDKYLENSFFGLGAGSRFADREYYTREPLEGSIALSRGFTSSSISQAGLRWKTIRNFRFAPGSRLKELPPSLNAGRASALSVFLGLGRDSRDSNVNPSRGSLLRGEFEWAPRTAWTNVHLTHTTVWLQGYSVLFYPKTILALRLVGQTLGGHALPVQFLLPVGGNRTLRGAPQDRYLGRSAAVANAEIRFPLFRRLGGVAGLDAGKVWNTPGELRLRGLPMSPMAGLRLYLDTFVVRMDLGFGRDTVGFYLNFGQLF